MRSPLILSLLLLLLGVIEIVDGRILDGGDVLLRKFNEGTAFPSSSSSASSNAQIRGDTTSSKISNPFSYIFPVYNYGSNKYDDRRDADNFMLDQGTNNLQDIVLILDMPLERDDQISTKQRSEEDFPGVKREDSIEIRQTTEKPRRSRCGWGRRRGRWNRDEATTEATTTTMKTNTESAALDFKDVTNQSAENLEELVNRELRSTTANPSGFSQGVICVPHFIRQVDPYNPAKTLLRVEKRHCYLPGGTTPPSAETVNMGATESNEIPSEENLP